MGKVHEVDDFYVVYRPSTFLLLVGVYVCTNLGISKKRACLQLAFLCYENYKKSVVAFRVRGPHTVGLYLSARLYGV